MAIPRLVDKAFAGVDSVFWLCPPDSRAPSAEVAYVDFTRPAAVAINRHKVARVVGISALDEVRRLPGMQGW